MRLLIDHGDLGVDIERVVGPDLGAETILERGDVRPRLV